MFNLSTYLEKFKNLKDPKENKTIITHIILESTGVTIKEEDITIQKSNIYIQNSSLAKNRIFLNKENIIKKINERIENLNIQEIF